MPSIATPKQRAINKTKLEMYSAIFEAIKAAKESGYGELLYFIYCLHFVRVTVQIGDIAETDKEKMALIENQLTEAYKYLIQLFYRNCHNGFVEYTEGMIINSELVQKLTKDALNINNKYETLAFLALCKDVEVSGDRDQFLKMNLETLIEDDHLSEFFYYFARIEQENDIQKSGKKTKEDFLAYFINETTPYADLFEAEFNVTIHQFVKLIDFILETVTNQVKSNEKHFFYLENGRVDIQAYKTIYFFTQSLFISKKLIYDTFGYETKTVLERLTFNPEEFDPLQLRYNLIARQPLLDFDDKFLISPELLLDSMLVNTHYALLEAGSLKEEYKDRYASVFVDKISVEAQKYGYTEVGRELELYKGKNQIGDIDLILKNSSDHYLLIEAKNHTIPMDVYFHDLSATEARLNYLKLEWEGKVERRYQHLQDHHSKYGIGPSFNYLIVSKFPEILSHFSSFLVLTINEFEYWLGQNDTTLTFQKLHEDFYNLNESALSVDQMNEMLSDLNTGLSFGRK